MWVRRAQGLRRGGDVDWTQRRDLSDLWGAGEGGR